jgi:hypothetical protein
LGIVAVLSSRLSAQTGPEARGFVGREAGELVEVCAVRPGAPHYLEARAFCHGYLTGAYSTLLADRPAGAPPLHCNLPASRQEPIDGFVAWVQARPDQLRAFPPMPSSGSWTRPMPALTADRCGGSRPTRGLAAAALALALLGAGCVDMDDRTRRTVTGAGLGMAGGALVGSLTGDAGWGALVGAGVGGAGGYLYDRNQRRQDDAYRRGLQDGRRGQR